jgi:hypothetical protein
LEGRLVLIGLANGCRGKRDAASNPVLVKTPVTSKHRVRQSNGSIRAKSRKRRAGAVDCPLRFFVLTMLALYWCVFCGFFKRRALLCSVLSLSGHKAPFSAVTAVDYPFEEGCAKRFDA